MRATTIAEALPVIRHAHVQTSMPFIDCACQSYVNRRHHGEPETAAMVVTCRNPVCYWAEV